MYSILDLELAVAIVCLYYFATRRPQLDQPRKPPRHLKIEILGALLSVPLFLVWLLGLAYVAFALDLLTQLCWVASLVIGFRSVKRGLESGDRVPIRCSLASVPVLAFGLVFTPLGGLPI